MGNPFFEIRQCAALLFAFGLLLTASCRQETPRSVEPIAHNASYDIWPDSIELHNGVVLRAMSDSLMQVRVNGNILDSIVTGGIPDGRMTFSSSFPLLDFLYRLEASCPSAGRYSAIAPYEIYLNPLQNDSAMILLAGRLRNGLVVPSETKSLGWPTVNSNAEWLLAASELCLASGDSRWEKTVRHTANAAIMSDGRICRNPVTGLFTGIPRHLASCAGILPRWMDQSDIFQLSTLAVNVAYVVSMNNLGIPSDSLTDAIKDVMWIPEKGYLSGMTYGVPSCPVALQSADNLAQAVAVISGVIPDAMGDVIISKTPSGVPGVSHYQPSLPPASGETGEEIPRTLLQVAWAVAAARRGNEAAYSTATGALFAVEGERLLGYRNRLPVFRSTFTAFIIRALLGMEFSNDGVRFHPYVPENLPGEKRASNLRYRKAVLDIKINGTGKVISTFTIDGKPSEPFLPASLEGRHRISITLAGATSDPGIVTSGGGRSSAPLPPVAEWVSQTQAELRPGSSPDGVGPGDQGDEEDENVKSWQVYVNGILREEMSDDTYLLHDAVRPSVVQFTALSNSGASGFSSKPYLFPQKQCYVIEAPSLAKSGTKILEDKALASKFVESNRFRNRNISFDFESPEKGQYLVEVHYANGLGIVNSKRKVALRRFLVNGREEGMLVFSQLSAANAPRGGEPWQEMTTWSNSVIVDLEKGTSRLELRYYQPSPVYSDPNSNVVLFDLVRLTPVKYL